MKLYFLRYYLIQNVSYYKSFQMSFGIGITLAKKVGSLLGLHPFFNNKSIFKPRKNRYYQFRLDNIARAFIPIYKFDNELKRIYAANIKGLKDIRCYKGFRHEFGLPTRGQRSHTNASSIKGLAGSFKGFNIQYTSRNEKK